jgi:hypothetical protein
MLTTEVQPHLRAARIGANAIRSCKRQFGNWQGKALSLRSF